LGVKGFDSGYVLAHALQVVLDVLPESTTLRIRTSQGYTIECKPSEFKVVELHVLPKSTTYINVMSQQPAPGISLKLRQFSTGESPKFVPWVYLLFGGSSIGGDGSGTDGCVALDLVSPMLGVRGLAGEVFAMEQVGTYHDKVLSTGADQSDDFMVSSRINPSDSIDKSETEPREVAVRVLARLRAIARGERFYCSNCGKEVEKAPQCAKCRKVKYCGAVCQKKAWKYHKVWCGVDGAS